MEQLKSEQIRVQAEERRKTLNEETRQHQAVRATWAQGGLGDKDGAHRGPRCSLGLLLTHQGLGMTLCKHLRPVDSSALSVTWIPCMCDCAH